MKLIKIITATLTLTALSNCAAPEGILNGFSVRLQTDLGDVIADQNGFSGEIIVNRTSGK